MFGLCTAGMAVSRGEGIAVSMILLSALPLLTCLPRRGSSGPHPVARRIAAAAAAWVVFFVGISPFCTVNLVKYDAFVTDTRLAGQMRDLDRALRKSDDKTGGPTAAVRRNAARSPSAKPAFAIRLWECTNASLRGGFELYWAFTVIGILALLYRRKWRWEFSALLILYLIHQAIYLSISIAYRYSIYLVPMFMPFTVTGMTLGLEAYRNWHPLDRWRHVLDAALVAGALIYCAACIDNGMQIVFGHKDNAKRAAAAFIREWGERNVPGRRLRIADDGEFPEVTYWSGAFRVSGGNSRRRWDECRDCDLVSVGDPELPAATARSDLKFLKSFELGKEDQVHLFRMVPTAGKEQK